MKKKPQKKRTERPFTAKEQAFITAKIGGANDTEAARLANYKQPKVYGHKLMQNPAIKQAIAEGQRIALAKAAKETGKRITITRNDIINRLDKLSQNAESDSAKVSALKELSEIFQLKPKREGGMFEGWSDEELEYYRTTGEIPLSRVTGNPQDVGLSANHGTADNPASPPPPDH